MGEKNNLLEREDLAGLLEQMITIRTFEEKAIEYSRKGIVLGNMHMYIGQEAIAAGVMKNLRTDDMITSSHRSNGHLIAKGVDPGKIMAELMGRQNGLCRGLAGKMHMADPEKGVMGANAIVGAGIPLAVGHALYSYMYNPGQVTVCFFGDGAVNNGYFHEGINLGALWKLPVVFICENNLYAISTHIEKSSASSTIAQKAESYDIPGIAVDGNDVMAVYARSGEAIERARAGQGPTLIECKTYRLRGHHEGDDQKYRTKQEVERWVKRCPIQRLRGLLKKSHGWTDEDDNKVASSAADKVQKAIEYGMQGDPTTEEGLERYLYETEVPGQ